MRSNDEMHNFKSYEKIGTAVPSSHEAPRKWNKRALVTILSSVVLVVSAVCVGIGFLRPTNAPQQQENGPSGVRTSDLIETVCNRTLYFQACNSSLSAYPGALKANVSELAKIAVELSLEEAFTLRLNTTVGDDSPGSRAAIEDCVELLDDTVDRLNASLSALAEPNWRQRTDDVKTWLSAALTNPSTCVEGFDDVDANMQQSMKQKLECLTELTSNALAIVNYVSSSPH